MSGIAHWDEVRAWDADVAPMKARWRSLGTAAGGHRIGAQRIDVEPGWQSTPVHAHGLSEETFFVLAGDGFVWIKDTAYAISAGDCIVHHAAGPGHTLVAGPGGLSVLAFGGRPGTEPGLHARSDTQVTYGFRGVFHPDHPFQLEAGMDPVDVSAPAAERPRGIVALADVEPDRRDRAGVHRVARYLGDAAGARVSGLTHFDVDPGALANIPHCHSAEEELFVVLEGSGTVELSDVRYEPVGELAVRAGSVVSRVAGSRVSHAFRAGDDGLVMLGYSDMHRDDMCFYPRSRKLSMTGVGVMFRVPEQLDYFDGEE